ncbi:hypothetical protein YC2023_072528 [Brassica napus]
MTQNYKSNTKITYVFFETLFCPIHPRSSTVVVKFWAIGETTQVISQVQGMKSRTTFYFSDLFDEKSSSSTRLLLKSSGQCIEDFKRSLPRENFYISLLKVFPKSFQCRKMSTRKTSRKVILRKTSKEVFSQKVKYTQLQRGIWRGRDREEEEDQDERVKGRGGRNEDGERQRGQGRIGEERGRKR